MYRIFALPTEEFSKVSFIVILCIEFSGELTFEISSRTCLLPTCRAVCVCASACVCVRARVFVCVRVKVLSTDQQYTYPENILKMSGYA